MNVEKKAQEIIDNYIPEDLEYYVFRILWEKYIKEDCIAIIKDQYADEDFTEEQIDEIAGRAAHEYCYDGEYDCNYPYWDNLTEIVSRLVKDYLS